MKETFFDLVSNGSKFTRDVYPKSAYLAAKEFVVGPEMQEFITNTRRSRSNSPMVNAMRFWVELDTTKQFPKLGFQIRVAFVEAIDNFFGDELDKIPLHPLLSTEFIGKVTNEKIWNITPVGTTSMITRLAIVLRNHIDMYGFHLNELCHQQLGFHNIKLPQGFTHKFDSKTIESIETDAMFAKRVPKSCACVIC